MIKRKIVHIDPDLCDGCGLCVPNCAEGAIRIVDGKAVLSEDALCDGLGNCLGECPQGAITIEEREAAAFDESKVHAVVRQKPHGCPSSLAQEIAVSPDLDREQSTAMQLRSQFGQWPIQLHLLPLQAPFYQGREMVVAADCVPFSFADLHRKFLAGRSLAIFCPKLDGSNEEYIQKLAAILAQNDIPRVHAVIMEVPCCGGLVRIVQDAIKLSGRTIPLGIDVISISGDIKAAQ